MKDKFEFAGTLQADKFVEHAIENLQGKGYLEKQFRRDLSTPDDNNLIDHVLHTLSKSIPGNAKAYKKITIEKDISTNPSSVIIDYGTSLDRIQIQKEMAELAWHHFGRLAKERGRNF